MIVNIAILLTVLLIVGSLGVRVQKRARARWVRGLAGAVVLVVVVVGIAGIVTEIIGRYIYDRSTLPRRGFQEYSAGRYVLRPGSRVDPRDGPGWHQSVATINSDGIRGEARRATVPSSPDATRVMFFGDSRTFGVGLNDDETFPAQAATVLHTLDPSHGWVTINAGIPDYNAFSSVSLFAWLAERYRPQVAVFVLGEGDDILPDVNDEMQLPEDRLAAVLGRFVLYRLTRFALAAADYRRHFTLTPSGELTLRPDSRAGQDARLRESIRTAGETARRIHCKLLIYVLREKSREHPGETLAQRIAASRFSVFADAGASFAFAYWDGGAPGMAIPNDGHPTPVGARFLAEQVAPAIRDAVASQH